MNKLTLLTHQEFERQRDSLNLIASENYPSPATLALLSSVWGNKYAEGYPGKRYYAGNIYSDELESYVQGLALKAFDPTGEYGVNVQALSGSLANATVYLSVLEAGDTILSLGLPEGGHLSHLHSTSSYRKFFNHATYGLRQSPDGYLLDLEGLEAKLHEHHPKLVVVGYSAYPPAYEFAPLVRLAHRYNCLVLADIAHISGLVAAGLHDSPFKTGGDGADLVTMTTHKTLRGPRGALIFAKHSHMPQIDRTIFPGTSGGPHLHQIASVGQALLEVIDEDRYPDKRSFSDYARHVITTAQALEEGTSEGGLRPVSKTGTHLSLLALPQDIDSLELQKQLESLGIITNRNAIPGDSKSAWRPSGLRLGTAALASRGLTAENAKALGRLIARITCRTISDDEARREVARQREGLAWYYKP